jgi:zinc transport system ATP-binding protein
VARALQEVGLPNIQTEQLGTLSGGQFQRVMVARALMHDKHILIFDEPSAGVDVAAEKTIYDLIVRLNKERGTTAIIISHELDIVFNYASDVICLNKRLVCHGAPKKVITQKVLEEMYGHLAGAYHHQHRKK